MADANEDDDAVAIQWSAGTNDMSRNRKCHRCSMHSARCGVCTSIKEKGVHMVRGNLGEFTADS